MPENLLQLAKVTSIEQVHTYFSDHMAAHNNLPLGPGELTGKCYVCQTDSVFQFIADAHPVNWRESLTCRGCGLINRWRSSFHLFEQICSPDQNTAVYITEAVTPLYKLMRKRYPRTKGSEYSSQFKSGNLFLHSLQLIQMQDVTSLTHENAAFEAVLSFDVLEHLADYPRALSEFHRVLKPKGHVLISVPFTFEQATEIRAIELPDGTIKHLLAPEYHGDPLSAKGVLCFQNFGMDLLDRMALAGFEESYLGCYSSDAWGYLGANIMFVGRKA
ncbi:MAG TPA: class I SAM-dependent methyltransferase [Xanthomonadales bacterium]|nr:class I SAM-dependent methyltransferase [Xanthomonadales bacterium]